MRKKLFTRAVTLLLALALVFTAAPRLSLRASAEPCSGDCGIDLTWSFDPESGVLTIEGSGAMTDYSKKDYNRAPWYSFRDSITSVSLPDGITSIGDYAFYQCTALNSVSFPAGLRSIGTSAFQECSMITELVLPASLTAVKGYAFLDCSALTKMIFQGNQAYITTTQYGITENGQEDTPEDLMKVQSLGPKDQVVVYGPSTASDGDAHVSLWYGMDEDGEFCAQEIDDMCLKSFTRVCGYTFYATDVFSDVKAGAWYEIPVAWAYGKGITTGTGGRKFSPDKTCTREQVVTFLWKALGSPEPETTTNPFPKDVDPTQYYYKAVLWAKENGVTGGVGKNKFGVGQACTREQVVTFLWKALGSPEPESTANPFPKDVDPTQYYYKAVLWAKENGVTGGVGKNKFGVGQSCTRGQIVTFLYKAVG